MSLSCSAALGALLLLTGCNAHSGESDNATARPALERAVDDLSLAIGAGQFPGLTSMMVSYAGQPLAEAYGDGVSRRDRHDIRSATKSITAILIGQLLEDGLIADVHVRVAPLLPEPFAELPHDDPRRSITIEDLLTMRSGLACDDWVPASVGHEDKMYETDDWTAFLLNQPLAHDIGEHFSYCTGGVVLLGRVIEGVTGETVTEYADRKLFSPLAIQSAVWATTPEGGTDTGGHLELTARDFHQIGVLIANGGTYGERRILDQQWLREMIGVQTDVYERRSRYGYLWWIDEQALGDKTVRYVYAHGNGGNFVFVVPEFGLVASFTGTNFGSRLQFQPLEIFLSTLLPALMEERP